MAVAAGVLLAAWGVETRVRRRVATGAVATVLALLLLVLVPLVPVVPEPTGAALWAVVAAVGVLAIAAAARLEHGRAAIRHGLEHLSDLMRGWE